MSDEKYVLTPLGESVYFAYVTALAKKHNCTYEEAIEIAKKEIEGNNGN